MLLLHPTPAEGPWEFPEEYTVSEQIGASSNDNPPTLTFYVKSMGVRRELIPGEKDGQKGYTCVTFTNTGRKQGDRLMVTQTEFEKVLVDMRLMESNAPSRRLGPTWPSAMDNTVRGVNTAVGWVSKTLLKKNPSRRLETWLPILK